jgi:general L-amino acid transport system permease protein
MSGLDNEGLSTPIETPGSIGFGDPENPQIPDEPPPAVRLPPGQWVKENLFSNWSNTLLTIVFGAIVGILGFRLIRFVFFTAEWEIVRVNLANFTIGAYPRGQLERLWGAVFLVSLVSGIGTGVAVRRRGPGDRVDLLRRAAPALLVLVTLLAFTQTVVPALLVGASAVIAIAGRFVGLRLPLRAARLMPVVYVLAVIGAYLVITAGGGVAYNNWGGFMLNLFLALGGILLSFPFGVLLALGRRSTFPAVRMICVGYIELIRGVPLISLLIMSSTMLGFFLPVGMTRPGGVTRALVAFVLFAAAYVAEDVRGGLQSVPKGQLEAAKAIGLSPIKTTFLIVLPQALRNVIPALVGQFISLTKDTSLVSILAVADVLRVARVVTSQPAFVGQGLNAETLLFAGFLFWSVCFSMARASQRLEKRLGVGER